MASPLHKRFPRELKDNLGKYLGIFLLMSVTIALTSGFLLAAHSIGVIIDDMPEKYSIEDARFTTAFEATDEQLDAAADAASDAGTGGTDIVAKIFHKYWGVAYGKVIIYTDILIIGSTLLVGYGLSDVVYGYIVTVVVGTSVDLLMAGSQQSNQIFIVTADYDRMAEAILHEADRGVTLIDATGGYSRHEIRIVMVVCYKRDAGHVLRIARDVDPKAFVTIASVSGTYGEGFRKLTQLR